MMSSVGGKVEELEELLERVLETEKTSNEF